MQVRGVGKNGLDQSRMIEDGIAHFGVAQKIDQRNLVRSRAGERAHDEIEIRSGEPRPTIRPDHRALIISNGYASWQALFTNVRSLGRGRGGIRTHGPVVRDARFRVECLKPDSATLPKGWRKRPTPKTLGAGCSTSTIQRRVQSALWNRPSGARLQGLLQLCAC
jgi:hypothetical protein